MQLTGKHILVMGLGVHGGGLGVVRFLVGQGARVTVTDLRGPEQLGASLTALEGLQVTLVLGEHREQDFQQADMVVRNPAVPRESRFLQLARAAGVPVEMEMSLFFRLCPATILGITGTKGKTTTTMLTAAMIQAQYPDAVVAGNLRVSALEQLPHLRPDTPVILELSSFALEGLGEARLSPAYAAITNLSADHLDRYASMASYAEAKQHVYAWQDANGLVALNTADPGTQQFYADPPPGRRLWFAHDLAACPAGELAVGWERDMLWWRDQDGTRTALVDAGAVRLTGQHNRVNIATAAALAFAYGVTPANLRRAVAAFGGVEHRYEFVRELAGVTYINDTAATAPEAAIAAIESTRQPIVLIGGGADKNLPFDQLATTITRRVKTLILLDGTATPKLIAALEQARQANPSATLTIDGPYNEFTAAIGAASQLAKTGDTVLLSPGCASFGMFRNEFHRGEEFRRIVAELINA